MKVGNLIKDKWGFGVVLKVCWAHKEMTVFWVNDEQTSTFPISPLILAEAAQSSVWEVIG